MLYLSVYIVGRWPLVKRFRTITLQIKDLVFVGTNEQEDSNYCVTVRDVPNGGMQYK